MGRSGGRKLEHFVSPLHFEKQKYIREVNNSPILLGKALEKTFIAMMLRSVAGFCGVCVRMYMCSYVCMYVCTYICVFVRVYGCMCVRIGTCFCVCLSVCLCLLVCALSDALNNFRHIYKLLTRNGCYFV